MVISISLHKALYHFFNLPETKCRTEYLKIIVWTIVYSSLETRQTDICYVIHMYSSRALSICQNEEGSEPMDTTLQSIIEIALQQGIWAALYIYLFFRMLKENAERETQYQQMINHLSTNVVEGIADINDKLDDMVRRLDNQSTWSPTDLLAIRHCRVAFLNSLS